MLASCVAAPRAGHLEMVLHIFAYIEKKHNSRLVFDLPYPKIGIREFKECHWRELYGNMTKAIPANAPVPEGKEVDVRMYVDSDHTGD
jgi:hypothetical protein